MPDQASVACFDYSVAQIGMVAVDGAADAASLESSHESNSLMVLHASYWMAQWADWIEA